MKKIIPTLTIVLASLALFGGILALLPQTVEARASYFLTASKSGLVEQTDFAPIELSLTNNSGSPITVGDIDVQRVNLPFEEGMETINDIPWSILESCIAVLGATDPSGPDGDCINIDGEWYRNTLDEKDNDVLPQPTIQPGETAVIAEISVGSPTSWRGWYGGGWVDLYAWVTIDGNEWAGGFVRHFIEDVEYAPVDAWFEQDNGDGTATFIVTGLESGLTKENFSIYQRIDDNFAGFLGRIISVTEDEEGAYIIIWYHVIANHNGICISADNNEGDNILDHGNIEIVTVSSSAIPRDFETTDKKEITSNIGDVKDLANTEIDLVFTATGFGSISFAPGLNLFDNQEQLEMLAELLLVSYDEDKNEMKAYVNTSSLTFLAEHGATIQFFDVAKKMGLDGLTEENIREYLDITVFDDGEKVVNLSDYFDWDEVTYDAELDILTLPVNHFTEYVLGGVAEEEKEEVLLPETGAAIVGVFSLGVLSLGGYTLAKKRKLLA